MSTESLKPLFLPKSIAIIGASREPRKFGHVILRNLLLGYEGKIYPVNPKTDKILGLKCYKSIREVGPVDLAVITIPAPLVPRIMEECAEAGVKTAIIISSGFREIGEVERREEVRKIIKKAGIRVLGPNCMGVLNPYAKVDTLFLPPYRLSRPAQGNIAFISQSGAFGAAILDWCASEHIGISHFISYGNMIDVTETELIEYLAKEKETKVIVAYLEEVSDGRAFMKVAKKVTKRKPIVVFKAGATKAGARAVTSHTGSLAGDDQIFSAACKQTGIIRAHTTQEIFDIARALAYQKAAKGRNIGIVTNGGGFGVMTTDYCERAGLVVPELSEEAKKRLRKELPPHAVPHNPLDLVSDADSSRYKLALEIMVNEKNIDAILVITLFQTSILDSEVVDVISEISNKTDKPLLVISAGGGYTKIHTRMFEENLVPVYPCPARAVNAVRCLVERGINLRLNKNL